MARSNAKKKLVVDGTSKLAAKGKPNDKHDAPNLNIEQATVGSPRPTRKRAGDYFDFEGEEEAGVEASSKPAESKATKSKKAKTAPAKKADKAAKESRDEGNAGDDNKEETVGDRVKAGASKPPKGRKGKAEKKDVVIGPHGDTAVVEEPTAPEKEKKPKKSKATSKGAEKHKGETSDGEGGETVAQGAKAKQPKAPKGQKAAVAKDDVAIEPSGDTAAVEGSAAPEKEAKPKKDKAGAKDKPATKAKEQTAKTAKDASKETTSEAKPKPTKKGKKGEEEAVPEGGEATTASKVSKGKRATKKDASGDKAAITAPDLAMDEGPLETLLEAEKGKEAAPKPSKAPGKKASKAKAAEKPAKETESKPPSSKKAAKPKGENKKASKDEASKKTGPSADSIAPETSKSKKRKSPASANLDAVKSDILDPIAEQASATKKQKKAKGKSLGESVGDLLSSGLETATQGAKAVRESIGGWTGDLSKPITDSAPEVASAVIDAKNRAKPAPKKGKGKGKASADPVAEPDSDSDAEVDDQTAALLAGFESSGDEADVPSSGFTEDAPIPSLPNADETSAQLESLKTQNKEKSSKGDEPGVVYIGRIPHGFYEHQMRAYFSQFGPISRLRLSRNKKTGRSRHYAFVEFENEGVAKIVANTMDNYLMFGHQLKCKFVEKANLHEAVWKGADKRFKAVPWNKIEGQKLEVPVGKKEWEGRVEKEKRRRGSKLDKAKEVMGYEMSEGAAALKGVEDVVKKAIGGAGDEGEVVVEQETSLVTATQEGGGVVVSEEVKTTVNRKGEVTMTTSRKTKRGAEGEGERDGKKARKGRASKGDA